LAGHAAQVRRTRGWPTSGDQELINTVALAMRHRIRATELRDAIYTHPSSTEAFNEVLGTIVRADEPRLART
jgi:hypothetical protein